MNAYAASASRRQPPAASASLRDRVTRLLVEAFLDDELTVGEYRLLIAVYGDGEVE
jgi:hypothetical protein